jgi:Exportin-T
VVERGNCVAMSANNGVVQLDFSGSLVSAWSEGKWKEPQSVSLTHNETAAQLEQWILQSAAASPSSHDTGQRQSATVALQGLVDRHHQERSKFVEPPNEEQHATRFPDLLFQLLVHSKEPVVLFYALTTLGRISLSLSERAQLRAYLLQATGVSSLPLYIRNKMAFLLAQDILLTVPQTWTAFIHDFIHVLSQSNPWLYLKTIETLLEDFHHSSSGPFSSSASSYHHRHAHGESDDPSEHTAATTTSSRSAVTHHSAETEHGPLLLDGLDGRTSTRRVKDFFKGRYDAKEGTTSTVVSQLFLTAVRILEQNADIASISPATEETTVRALQAIAQFLMWTDLEYLTGPSNDTAADQCQGQKNRLVEQKHVLEVLLRNFETTASRLAEKSGGSSSCRRQEETMRASLRVWREWITTTTTFSDRNHERETNVAKIQVLTALLQKIHESNVLPYSGESYVSSIEIVIDIAQLVNATGLEMLAIYDSTRITGGTTDKHETRLLQDKVPDFTSYGQLTVVMNQVMDLFFRAFAYDDIDVSAAVIPFAMRLTSSMESESLDGNSNSDQVFLTRPHLPQLLNTLYQQLKYPLEFSYDFDDDNDETAAEEAVYRTELCKLYGRIVRASPTMCLQFICEGANALSSIPGGFAQAPTPDVEAILRLLYHYCEGIRPAPGLKVVMKDSSFCSVLVAIHRSSVSMHHHREVLCLYYETTVRYYPIFEVAEYTPLLSQVLESMTGPKGLQNPFSRLRSRCCYLLLRLIKSIPSLLLPYVETAVTGIQNLLLMQQNSQPLNQQQTRLRAEDTFYLFETIGILLGQTGFAPDRQHMYLAQVLQPHVRSIDTILSKPAISQDPEYYGEILASSVAALAHLSKGFQRKRTPEVQSIFLEAMTVSFRVLQAIPTCAEVRNKTMIILPGMIQCLDSQSLPYMPQFLAILVQHATTEDISFVAQLLNQLCIKFKADAVPALDEILLLFLGKCRSLIPNTNDVVGDGQSLPPHLRTEQLSIQKLVFAVLHHVVLHGATAVLLSPRNLASFEFILQTMNDGAVHITDATVMKTCVRFFRELLEQWVVPATSAAPQNGASLAWAVASPDEAIRRRFLVYASQVFLPGCMVVTLDSSFDERDATYARVVAEVCGILSLIRGHTSDVEYSDVLARFPTPIADAIRGVSSAKEIEASLHVLYRTTKRKT